MINIYSRLRELLRTWLVSLFNSLCSNRPPSRPHGGEEVGGGFWGSEGSKDLEVMRQGTLQWAMNSGASVVSGNCATMPTSLGHYADVELPAMGSNLLLKAETNADVDAHLFIGKIVPILDGIFAVGFLLSGKSLLMSLALHV